MTAYELYSLSNEQLIDVMFNQTAHRSEETGKYELNDTEGIQNLAMELAQRIRRLDYLEKEIISSIGRSGKPSGYPD